MVRREALIHLKEVTRADATACLACLASLHAWLEYTAPLSSPLLRGHRPRLLVLALLLVSAPKETITSLIIRFPEQAGRAVLYTKGLASAAPCVADDAPSLPQFRTKKSPNFVWGAHVVP